MSNLAPVPGPSRLYRNPRRGKVKGVCAGIAEYFGISPLPLRLLAILGLFTMTLPTLFIYFVAAWVLDPEPEALYRSSDEAQFWRKVRVEPSGTARSLRFRFRDWEDRLRRMEAFVTSSEFELRREFRTLGREDDVRGQSGSAPGG